LQFGSPHPSGDLFSGLIVQSAEYLSLSIEIHGGKFPSEAGEITAQKFADDMPVSFSK